MSQPRPVELRSEETTENKGVEPNEPLYVICPQTGPGLPQFQELWANRELLFNFATRDVRLRYKQSVLGVAWAILKPVLATGVLTLFFGKLAKLPSSGVPYLAFCFASVLHWNFFASAITQSTHSVVSNAPMFTKIYFPRLIVPLAFTLLTVADLLVGLVLLAAIMIWAGVAPSFPSVLLYPVVVFGLYLFALGLGLWLGAINVRARDIGNALPVLMQLGMFGSPVIYSADIVPERFRFLYQLNPMVGYLEGLRSALFGLPWDLSALGISAAVTAVFFISGLFVYSYMSKTFADVV